MAVNKFNGVSISTSSKIFGLSGIGKIFGQSISAGGGGGHSAPVYRSTSAAAIVGTDAVIDKPAGTTTDDYLVAIISVDGGARTITPPAGWTQLVFTQKATGDGQTVGVYGKKAGGSEGATYTFVTTGSLGGGGIVCYSGVDTTTAMDVAASSNSNDGGASPVTVTATGITTVTDNALALWVAATDQGANNPAASAAFAPPSGFTERVDNSSYDWTTFTVAEKVITSAGATGSASGTFTAASASHGYVAFLLALRPV